MKTKIIATIGPASEHYETLKKMISAGMSIARFNTKYGSVEQFVRVSEDLRILGDCQVLYDIKGEKMVEWLKNQDFDYLAVSFAETKKQIDQIRKKFAPRKIKIIAKIESDRGMRNIDDLIRSAEGIMVARGDLGENISLEKVPLVQKEIIKKCNQAKKMVITATEMLLSMVDAKKPERAEVSDVANAVLDGSDAVMLSEETSLGENPVLVIKTMAKVIKEIEKSPQWKKK